MCDEIQKLAICSNTARVSVSQGQLVKDALVPARGVGEGRSNTKHLEQTSFFLMHHNAYSGYRTYYKRLSA